MFKVVPTESPFRVQSDIDEKMQNTNNVEGVETNHKKLIKAIKLITDEHHRNIRTI